MPSKTDIANFALSYVGDQPIVDFGDETKRARLVSLFYDEARRRALRLHTWNCVSTKASLPVDAGVPVWGFDLQYKLPADFERLIDIENVSGGVRYEIEGGFLQTNLSAPLGIKYVRNESDTTKFDSLLVTVVAYSLALDLVEPLTQSNTKKQEMEVAMRFWLTAAKMASGMERQAQRVRDTSWINARRRGA